MTDSEQSIKKYSNSSAVYMYIYIYIIYRCSNYLLLSGNVLPSRTDKFGLALQKRDIKIIDF